MTKIEAIHFKVTVTSEVLEKSSKFGYNITSYFRKEGLTEQWLFFLKIKVWRGEHTLDFSHEFSTTSFVCVSLSHTSSYHSLPEFVPETNKSLLYRDKLCLTLGLLLNRAKQLIMNLGQLGELAAASSAISHNFITT